jgi:hypothetical protein
MPIALYPMDRIAQLTFHTLSSDEKPTDGSQFTASFEPTLGRVRSLEEEQRLRKMVSSAMHSHQREDACKPDSTAVAVVSSE